MKTAYTPGPWNLEAGRSIQTKNGSFYITYGKDKNGNPNFPDFCELDRNAHLVSAAPELLHALKTILTMDVKGHQLQDRLQFSPLGRKILNEALAAIDKAHGVTRDQSI